MTSALRTRAVRQLTRRGARSWLLVATVAASVAGVWLLAIPMVIDGTMQSRVEASRLDHVRLHPAAAPLTDPQIEALADLPNVAAADGKLVATGEVTVGGRTLSVDLIGVRDFAAQQIDIVSIDSGVAPGDGEALVDAENLRHHRLDVGPGETLGVTGPNGRRIEMPVTGTGGSVLFSSTVREFDPVIYTTAATLRDLTGWPGVTSIELQLEDRDPAAVDATIDALEARIDQVAPGTGYWRGPIVRPEGEWPGQEGFDRFRSLFGILAAVAVVSGLFLVYNGVNAMVRREAAEIGTMKALGGRRRQVARSYLEAAALMGLVATIAGTIVGILLINLLIGAIGSSLMSTRPDFGAPAIVFVIAATVGVGGTMLAAVPGVMWATRMPVREALDSHGIATADTSRLDRAMRRITFLSRSAQLGLRDAARNKTRTVATGVQIGFAVGTAIAFIALAATMLDVVEATTASEAGDIHVFDQGGVALDSTTAPLIASIDGVASVHPIHYSALEYGGETYSVWALPADTIFDYDLVAGRWYEEGEADVVVVGQAAAGSADLTVGDTITVERFDGPREVEVVGIDRHMVDDGNAFFTPLAPYLAATGRTGSNGYWVVTTSPDPDTVDAAAGQIEAALRSRGHNVRTELAHVERAANRSEATLILTFIVLLGIPILAIGMIALVNTLTTNLLERTREIGVLRSIGARRMHLRRMLRAEGLAVAFIGWLIGLPVGIGLARLLIHLISDAFEATFPVVLPPWSLLVVLVLTLVVAAAVIRIPLRRLARLSAGEALRYQ